MFVGGRVFFLRTHGQESGRVDGFFEASTMPKKEIKEGGIGHASRHVSSITSWGLGGREERGREPK